MNRYYESSLTYLEDGADKETKVVYLVDAMSFMEAESNLTKYLNEWDIEDFNIKSIKKVAYDDLVYRVEDDEYDWFEANVRMKIDGDKEASFVYLVADIDTKSAIGQLNEYLKDSDGDCRVVQIKWKPIADIVLRKECCKECSTCESTVRILGFEQQKGIDLTFKEMDEENSNIAKDLGAISLSMNSYKVKVNPEGMEFIIGKVLARRVVKSWEEDFVDEDTGDIVSINRNEIVLGSGWEIMESDIETIISSGQEVITLKR